MSLAHRQSGEGGQAQQKRIKKRDMLLNAEEEAHKEEAEHKACMHEINSFRDNLGGARGPFLRAGFRHRVRDSARGGAPFPPRRVRAGCGCGLYAAHGAGRGVRAK